MMSVKLNDIATLNFKGSDYVCIISLISKNDSIKLLQNTYLTEKSGALQIKRNIFILNVYIKFDDIKIPKQKFHQHKIIISVKNIEIDKIVVSSKALFVKKDLNILLVAKMIRKLNLCVYFSPK